ncbi:MAG: ComF family protein [Rhodospirillales bacterium]|nr:ComF family protein [Rhodospirillales bacterium]
MTLPQDRSLGLRRTLAAAGRFLLDAVLPLRCLGCGAVVSAESALCAACWSGLTFLGEPCCTCCGLPFPFDQGTESFCPACVQEPPSYDRARAAVLYDDASRRLILAFKHGDRPEAATSFARWMQVAGWRALESAEIILPVPLHPWRLFKRRYNQAALLAQALGAESGLAVDLDLLRRTRATPVQGHLSRVARQRNVAGAFGLAPGAENRIQGRHLLLVDDVMTSGATLNEVAKVLRRGGAENIDVLTLARVLRETPY